LEGREAGLEVYCERVFRTLLWRAGRPEIKNRNLEYSFYYCEGFRTPPGEQGGTFEGREAKL
jgi:hypothetical protein